VAAALVPTTEGSATLVDASAWDLFDGGDAIFLSALSNFGVGGCAAGAPVGGFGQAGQTCGAGAYLAFSYATPHAYDPASFTLLNLEAVGLTSTLPAGSADAFAVVPEPSTVLLVGQGLLGVLVFARRRARRRMPSTRQEV
jgi:hypothetical protein